MGWDPPKDGSPEAQPLPWNGTLQDGNPELGPPTGWDPPQGGTPEAQTLPWDGTPLPGAGPPT